MAPGEVAVAETTASAPADAETPKATPAASQSPGSAAASVLDGPFTTRQLLRIDEALTAADSHTGLTFSVYVGPLTEPTRAHAERLHDQLTDSANAVLLAISPNQRVLEIVTGEQASKRLPRQACALAALSMTASFGGGDLAGGIINGIRMLADQVHG